MPEPTPAKKEKILIIEGDEATASHIADSLRTEGYQVILVTNGADGLKSIYDNLPHLILLDVAVSGGGDAYDILAKKQAEPMLSKIPVFLLSMQGLPINVSRVPAGSVTEFLVALRADPADLVVKVNHALGHNETEPAAMPTGPGAGKKILWVEDDKLIGSVLARKFGTSGFDLFLAKNGTEALEHLKTAIPDAIVLDLILPVMSGFDILQEIRKDARLNAVPAMILSNLSKQSDIERAKILGAQKFIVKAAVSLDQIIMEVKGLCK